MLQTAYLVTLAGFLAFFASWESGDPRVPFGTAAERFRHLARNAALFALLFAATNIIAIAAAPVLDRLSSPSSFDLAGRYALAVPVQVALGVMALDLCGYAWHRLCHRAPWLWRLHRVHHAEFHLDVSTALRFHPIEMMLGMLLKFALLAVLGLPVWIEGVRSVLHTPLALAQHANVRFPAWLERGGRWLLMMPGLHRLHHSIDRRDYDLNYGDLFSWWDRLFGTYRAPAAEVAAVGLEGYDAARWQTVGGMLAAPFRPAPEAVRPDAATS